MQASGICSLVLRYGCSFQKILKEILDILILFRTRK
jgi:hypothetical protein